MCYVQGVILNQKTSQSSLQKNLNLYIQKNIIVPNVKDNDTISVRVKANNLFGRSTEWFEHDHLVIGKTAPPEDVQSFVATNSDTGVLLKWNHVSDIDRKSYELRIGDTWEGSTFLANITDNFYLIPPLVTDSYTYLIKAIDTTNHYSQNEASTSITIGTVNASTMKQIAKYL